MREEITTSFGSLTRRALVLLEIETEDGRTGLGESWVNFPAWAPQERLLTLRDGVFPLILGQDASAIETIHLRLVGSLEPLGRQWGATGPMMQAISAVDIALWDLAGKAFNCSVSEIIGRVRDDIPVYASSIGPGNSYEDVLRLRAAGFDAIKIALGFDQELDSETLASVARGCDGTTSIYADANQAWDLEEAIRMAPALREHGVIWIEEPVCGNDISVLETLYRRTGISIATGENVYGRQSFAPYVDSPAVEILQPDVSKAGGLTEVMAICHAAGIRGKAVVPHFRGGAVAFAATMQLAACCPAINAIEYDIHDNLLRDGIWAAAPHPTGGSVSVPNGPGLGIDVDCSCLTEPTESVSSSMR